MDHGKEFEVKKTSAKRILMQGKPIICFLYLIAFTAAIISRIVCYNIYLDNLCKEYFADDFNDHSRFGLTLAAADHILAGGTFSTALEGKYPDDQGLTIFLIIVRYFFGEGNFEIIRSLPIYLDLLTMLLLTIGLSRLFNSGTSVCFSFLYAVYMPSIITVAGAFYFIFALLNLSISIIVFLLSYTPRSIPIKFIYGSILGFFTFFATLIRANIIVIVPVILFKLFTKNKKRNRNLLLYISLVISIAFYSLLAHLLFPQQHHPLWHTYFISLGEIENPNNLYYGDSCGRNEFFLTMGYHIDKAFSDPYHETLKGRSLTTITEDKTFYLSLLLHRMRKVFTAEQPWGFFSIGLSKDQTKILTFIMTVLYFLGLYVGLKRKFNATLFMFTLFCCLNLSVVIVATFQANYYLAGSVYQLPLIAFFLNEIFKNSFQTRINKDISA